MTTEQKQQLVKAFSSQLKPLDTRPMWEWLHDHISLPSVFQPAGTFNIDFYPYLKRCMSDLTNDQCKQLNIASCIQAGKSLLQQLYIPYILLESPGPLMLTCDTSDNVKKVLEERVIPLLRHNKQTNKLLAGNRYSAKKSGLLLPHMTFRAGGPAESNVLGYSARFVLGDEIWRWEADYNRDTIEKLKGRQLAYNAIKKMLLVSQPDHEGSEWHKQCMKGLWWEYGYRCPSCRVLQQYIWNCNEDPEWKDGNKEYGMVFDDTEDGNYDKKAGSARLVCKHCFHEIKDVPESRKALVRDGDYILIHQGNDSSIHSYSWNQFVNLSIPFKQLGTSYFDAVIQKRTTGLRTKHELFRQQILGKFWKVGQQVDMKKMFMSAYASSEEWKDETIRFLTLDVQKDHLFWLVRSWSNKCPESRLIDWGSIVNFSELEDLKKKYKIHPLCIGIDSGYETKNVYAASIENGQVITLPNGKRDFARIICYKGDGGSGLSPKKFYRHKITENGKSIDIDRLYSTLTVVDPQFPVGSKYKLLKAHLYVWSNYSIKTILFNLRDNKLQFKWSVNNERANAEYQRQLFSEELSIKTGRYEQLGDTPNHLLDLEALQLVMALQADCYHPSASEMNSIAAGPELSGPVQSGLQSST